MNSPDNESKRISGCTLKVIALVCMLIDHIGAVLLESAIRNVSSTDLYQKLWLTDLLLRGIGRLAFPLFCFLLVEGFTYTHSKLRYARNLLVFALVSEIPFDLAFSHCLIDETSQNVYFTLLIGLLVLCCIERLTLAPREGVLCHILFYPAVCLFCGITARTLDRSSGLFGYLPDFTLWAAAIASAVVISICSFRWTSSRKYTFAMTVIPIACGILLGDLLQTDYSGLGVLAICMMWVFRKKHTRSIASGITCLAVGNLFETPSFFDLLLIRNYNGQRGHQIKYLFYLFYPVHLTILALINFQLGFAAFTPR